MGFKEKNIQLSCIDSGDNTYRITTKTCIDDLIDSIKNVGLMAPPILMKKTYKLIIVCGFRRVAACQSLGWSNIEARVLDSSTKKLECVKLAITDNALQRPLNLIESSRALYMLSSFIKDNKSLSKEASLLGLPENPSIIKKIKNICLLPEPIQNCILSNTISLAMALELGTLAKDEGVAFANLFHDLKLGLNKQREVIILVKEIALREDISIMNVLNETDLQKILNCEDLDRNQKTQKIRFYLKQRRFPAITSAKREFEKNVKKLKLGTDIRLIHPNNFEGAIYTLNLYFKNLIELKDRKATLDQIIQNPAIERILD